MNRKIYIAEEMVGKTVFNSKHNEWMRIIEWVDCKNILIVFEDGYTKRVKYAGFEKGITKKYTSEELKNMRMGETTINCDGESMTIVNYNSYKDILVKFDDGNLIRCEYNRFQKGSVRNINNRLGETKENKFGELTKIIKYRNCSDIDIEHSDGTIIHNARYSTFKKYNIFNPNRKSLHGIGYIGQGKYKSRENGQITHAYYTWKAMISRCYDPFLLNNAPTYINVFVCDEWHNFQKFGDWYDENYYTIDNEEMHLDKDFKNKARMYSPENCIFLPRNINMILIKRKSLRGEYPIGCALDKQRNKIRVQLNRYNKVYDLGHFNNKIDAFNAYKQAKEAYIKEIADSYKHKIPEHIYNILINYQVEITD